MPTDLPGPPGDESEIRRAPATAFVLGMVWGGLLTLVGGGIGQLIVPGLILWLRITGSRAVATAQTTVFIAGSAATWLYHHDLVRRELGGLSLSWILFLSIGGLLGSLCGAFAKGTLAPAWRPRVVGWAVLMAGLMLMAKSLRWLPFDAGWSSEPLHLGLVSALCAMVMSLARMGAGVLFVPIAALVFDWDQHLNQGTSIAMGTALSAVALPINALRGRIAWNHVAPLASGALFGVLVAAPRVSALTSPALQAAAAVFVILFGAGILRTRVPESPGEGRDGA